MRLHQGGARPMTCTVCAAAATQLKNELIIPHEKESGSYKVMLCPATDPCMCS
jgi:hypothetical protein